MKQKQTASTSEKHWHKQKLKFIKQIAGPLRDGVFVSRRRGIVIVDMLAVRENRQNTTAIQPVRMSHSSRIVRAEKAVTHIVPAMRQKIRRRFPVQRLSMASRSPETAESVPIRESTHAAGSGAKQQKSSRNFLPITV